MDDASRKALQAAHDRVPLASVRYQNKKITPKGAHLRPVPWCDTGYYLDVRPFFASDPLWHAGAYYVQEASSMFLEQAIKQHLDVKSFHVALDLCAAPGGKSTHIASLLSADSLLLSNEVVARRAAILTENMSKWGQVNTWVTQAEPHVWGKQTHRVDVLLVDAPCSGSGLFRKMPQYAEEWNPDLVKMCAARQEKILLDSYPVLCKDGLLVYMTCSLSVAENEAMVDFLMRVADLESLPVHSPSCWGIQECITSSGAYAYRLSPDKLEGEGFFLAVFRKKDGEALQIPPSITVKRKIVPNLSEYLDVTNHFIFSDKDMYYAIHPAHIPYLSLSTDIKV
jgi:tRNA and rRNA cytosine-C5-methylases